MVSKVIENHKSILHQMTSVIKAAEEIEDEGAKDLIGAYIRELEKKAGY